MKQFAVYQAPGGGEFQAVKQGWSWPGLLFGGIWALSKKLWLWGFGVIGVGIILGILPESYSALDSLRRGFVFGSLFAFGYYGNQLREKNLVKRGYIHRAIIIAKTPGEAVMQYINAPEGDPHEAVHDLPAQR